MLSSPNRHAVQRIERKPLINDRRLSVADCLRFHWPEYLMEAGEAGVYLLSACAVATFLWHPASPIQGYLPNDVVRRMLMGLAMGATIIAIVLSPWGKQSGAHFNPAVTFTFYRLGKVMPWDVLFYCIAQLSGAVAGVALASLLLRGAPAHHAVRYATLPGIYGDGIAFVAELVISFLLMSAILFASNHQILSPYTHYFAAILAALYIAFESPLSGMSTNPARTFGPAVYARYWHALWIYFVAPPLGMLAASEFFLLARHGKGRTARSCITTTTSVVSSATLQRTQRAASKRRAGEPEMEIPAKRVLILGAGFGGLYTALGLEKTIARDHGIRVTIVNRENHSLFTPMLHEVAASDLDMTHIVNPIRKLLKHVQFFNGEVQEIDLAAKRVTVVHGRQRHAHELGYDYLVIALGSTANFFGLDGLEHRALTIKSLSDAIYLRNHLIELLEQADFECMAAARPGLLTVVVAGGGFAGAETIAGINDFLHESVRFYRHLSKDSIRVILVHPGEVVLPELGPKLGEYAQKKLARRKVEIRLNTKVVRVDEHAVYLSDGSSIPTQTVIWTAGTSPNPLVGMLPCKQDRGRVVANEFLELPDWPGVWALGDCASIVDRDTGRSFPPTAQHAVRQGRIVAKNLTAAIRGGPKTAFSFSTLGLLAAIGRRTGVANILGANFSGFVAWFLWRTIYLSKLPRSEKKLRVALDWTLDLLFSKDIVSFLDRRG